MEDTEVETGTETVKITEVEGNEVLNPEKIDLDSLLAQIRAGSLDIETMKALRVAMKPESEQSIQRREAEVALKTFLETRLDSEDAELYTTFGDLLADIEELQGKVKSFSKRSASKTTVKWSWRDRNDRTDFQILAEGVSLDVSPENDAVWLKHFRENGFTVGQIAAVRKERPFRKSRGVLSMEELLELTT